jgi:hypothetical protein
MRGLYKYGIPATAALGAGGLALAQGEGPGTAGLAALGAGAGGAGALLGARAIAGKYSPAMVMRLDKALTSAGNVVGDYGRNLPERSVGRKAATGVAADLIEGLQGAMTGPQAMMPWPSTANRELLKQGLGALGVPAAAGAGAAVLGGGVGSIASSLGAPGFQQQMAIDPESYGSNNTMSAKAGIPTLMYR